MSPAPYQTILGSLVGTAVGDSLGLPAEGLKPGRIFRLWKGKYKQRLFFGKGMLSDDTDHSLVIATALIRHRYDVKAFQRCFARSLRWWLAALPVGVGLSTAKAIIKLWLGFPTHRSGVRSAGNGAAMRSAIIGVLFHDQSHLLKTYSHAAATVTHTDPRAIEAALLVAEAAALASHSIETAQVIETLNGLATSGEMLQRLSTLNYCLMQQDTVQTYAGKIGCGNGVSGFAPNSVAIALYGWLHHRGDFRSIITSVIQCGGDTDSSAAIAGAIAGAEVGVQGIPQEWIANLWDWPRSLHYIRRVADSLATENLPSPKLFLPIIPFRNLFFLVIVLFHGFRRLLPPY